MSGLDLTKGSVQGNSVGGQRGDSPGGDKSGKSNVVRQARGGGSANLGVPENQH